MTIDQIHMAAYIVKAAGVKKSSDVCGYYEVRTHFEYEKGKEVFKSLNIEEGMVGIHNIDGFLYLGAKDLSFYLRP